MPFLDSILKILASVMSEVMLRRINQKVQADQVEAITVKEIVKLLEFAIDTLPELPFMLKVMLKNPVFLDQAAHAIENAVEAGVDKFLASVGK